MKIRGLFTYCLLLLITTFSCKKLDKKNPIEFTIKAHIPYSGVPVVGIKYTIKEYRSKKIGGKLLDGSNTIWTDFKVEGRTGSDGLAHISFLPKKNLDYHYHIYFDYSVMEIPGYYGSVTLVNAPQFDYLARNHEKDYEIRALPKMQMQWNFKNLSCYDSNDTFKYMSFNLDEFPHYMFNNGNPWIEGPSLNGCVDLTGNFTERLSGHYVFKWEAVRGGVVTTGIDTFFVSPNGNNTVNMFW